MASYNTKNINNLSTIEDMGEISSDDSDSTTGLLEREVGNEHDFKDIATNNRLDGCSRVDKNKRTADVVKNPANISKTEVIEEDIRSRLVDEESDLIENERGLNGASVDENLIRFLTTANTAPDRPAFVKYGRSKSWCPRTGEELSGADIRLLRERLLRTQTCMQPSAIRNLSREQKMTLACLALVDFMSFCSMSIMAPFFPKEAEEKGLTESVSGFVFSFYALIMFVTSPLFGKILPSVGAKFLLMSGIFLAGSCNLLFGVLEYIYDYETFVTFCFLIRGLEALGASAYSTASYVFVVNTFPNNIGSVLGILETFIGLGMSVGPAIGGLLYSVGGFGLPFYVLGIAMVITLPVNYFLLSNEEDCSVSQKCGSLWELVKVPSVVITGLVIVVVSNTWAFLDPTLEPHLRQFNLDPHQVGLIFLLFSGLYGIFSPIWGWLSDRVTKHWCMMVWGLLFCTVGLLMLGPSPMLPFLKSSLWLNLLGLSIIGISVALTLLPTFQGVLSSSIEEGGCSQNIATYSMVAGVWSCMYSLGEVTGPSFGGVLLKYYGFPICSTVMAAFTFIMAIITMTFYALREPTKYGSGSDTFSSSNEQAESVHQSSSRSSDAGPSKEEGLLENHPLIGQGDVNTREWMRQSYGGTGISTKSGNVTDQIQRNANHKKYKAMTMSALCSDSDSEEESQTNHDCDNICFGKHEYNYCDIKDNRNESVIVIDNRCDKKEQRGNCVEDGIEYKKEQRGNCVEDGIEYKKEQRGNCVEDGIEYKKEQRGNCVEDGIEYKKNDSGLLPKLSSTESFKIPKSDIDDLLQYNKDKVEYYKQMRKDSREDLLADNQAIDVQGTVNMTSSGACEV